MNVSPIENCLPQTLFTFMTPQTTTRQKATLEFNSLTTLSWVTVLQTEHWWFQAQFVLFLLLDNSMAEGHPAMTQFNYNSSNWSPSQKLSSQNLFFPFIYSTQPAVEFQIKHFNAQIFLKYFIIIITYLNKKSQY